MDINKSTHEPFKTELFAPVMKGKNGKYMAVLSDNSVDRDDEMCSKECIEKLGRDGGYLAALCNHKNDVFMQVAEWTNRGVQIVDGYTALVSEPKFYKSNPNAMIIQGMLDEGAILGVSIGAIVKNYDELNGMRVFTELEIVEASFVSVPSNRHGRAMAVAKSFNKDKNMEGNKVENFTQKDIDSAVTKKAEEMKTEFSKQLESKVAEIEKMKVDLDKSVSELAKAKEEVEVEKTKSVDAAKKTAEMEASMQKIKDEALEKQKFADAQATENGSSENSEKAMKEGKLPIMRS